MNTNQFITTVVAVVIAVVVLSAMLPVFDSAEIRADGQNAAPKYYMDVAPDNYTCGLSDGKVMSGDFDMTSLTSGNATIAIAFCDSFIVYSYSSNTQILIGNGFSDPIPGMITVSDGVATYTNVSHVEKTIDIEGQLICGSSLTEGKYGYYTASISSDLNFNEDSVLYGFASSVQFTNSELTPTSVTSYCLFKGTQKDGFSIEVANAVGITDSTAQFVTAPTEESGYYAITTSSSLASSITNADGTYSNAGSTPRWIVPIEYTYLTSESNIISTIVSIVPLLIGIGILMAAILLVRTRN